MAILHNDRTLLDHLDRAAGCMAGLGVGDALGGPIEEIPGHPCKTPGPITDMISGGWLKLAKGQITDDTEMALCITRSIVEKERFSPEDIAARFLGWYLDSAIGAGGTTKAAMLRLKEGIPWQEASQNKNGIELTGNGTVMRCAPVALYAAHNSKLLRRYTDEQSIITHRHPDCIDSAFFVNSIIAQLVNGATPSKAYSTALDAVAYNSMLQERYARIPTITTYDITGEVKATTESAVACFLQTHTFEQAVINAVNLRGDADTRGAVTGAIAGAHYGITAIPSRWRALMDRNRVPVYEELAALGRRVYLLGYDIST